MFWPRRPDFEPLGNLVAANAPRTEMSSIHELMLPSLLALALSAPASAAPTAAVRAPEAASILVGASLPLSGSEANTGQAFQEGYQLAVEQVNVRGGLVVGEKQVPITLRIADDQSNPLLAAKLTESMASVQRVDFMLGSYSGLLSDPQSTIAEREKIPYVFGGAAAQLHEHGYRYAFGLLSPLKLLANAFESWLTEEQVAGTLPTAAKVAMAWEDTARGREYHTVLAAALARSKGHYQIVSEQSFPLNTKDAAGIVEKLKAAGADLFLADAHVGDFVNIHREYVKAGLCHKVVSYGARGAEQQASDALGAANVANLVSGVWWDEQLAADGLNKQFAATFRARFHHAPDWRHALSYETARVLFVAIEQAGSKDRDAVRAKLASLRIPSIVPGGQLSFPAAYGQQAHFPFLLLQNRPNRPSAIIYPGYLATAKPTAPGSGCQL
jgi:branched-chain amino acid transport system substrate-binding protein